MTSKEKNEILSQVPESAGAYQLIRLGVVIYVGSTANLRERFLYWTRKPKNPIVRALDWDRFRFVRTGTVLAAEHLEESWYRIHRPTGNLMSPPRRQEHCREHGMSQHNVDASRD